MPFPPLFKDFGKGINDLLFKKVYGDKKSLKTKSSVDKGAVQLETTVAAPKKGSGYDGTVVVKTKIPDTGSSELTLTTNNTVKGHVEFTKLHPGLTLKIKGGHQNDRAPDDVYTVAEADYRQENFVASLGVSHNIGKEMTVSVGGSTGFDGLAVGGVITADTEHVAPEKLDYKVGAEYSQKDFTTSVICATHKSKGAPKDKDSDSITAGFKLRATEDLDFGANIAWDVSPAPSQPTVLTVGTQFAVDANLKVKAKVNSQQSVEVAVEQRLLNPNLTFSLAAKFQADKAQPMQAFGFGFVFGDN